MMLNRVNYFWSYSLIIEQKNLHLIGQNPDTMSWVKIMRYCKTFLDLLKGV